MAIERLNASQPTDSALIPFYDAALGADARMTVAQLFQLLSNFFGGLRGTITQYANPNVNGWALTVAPLAAGQNVIVILDPTLSSYSITLNLPAIPADGQTITFHSKLPVTFSLVAPGAFISIGSLSAMAAGGFFTVRYDALTDTWYRVG